ncbi:MAG: alcohol dehydrogenase catalytic domain-containing protein [Anaerolineae bacterium]
MSDKLAEYKRGVIPAGAVNELWPLYGAGLENLGVDRKPITAPLPQYGPNELLVRHDACGLCFSDTKVIALGQNHPRIFRDISKEPVVLGHEVSLTVVGVGENLRDRYRVGDRFIVQAEIYYKGVNWAYGYMLQGGLSRYNVLDERVLNGDDGVYLIPVRPETGYAEAALAEPWACVTAAYGLSFRTGLKPGGTMWIIGAGDTRDYTISAGFDAFSHPARVMLTNVPEPFASWVRERAAGLGVELLDVADVAAPPVAAVDDIVLLGADPDLVEAVSPRLAKGGVFAIIADRPMPRKVSLDAGRIHYDGWAYVGGPGPDIAAAYAAHPVRSELKAGGKAWFIGAAGPMGRMHVQRAIEMANGPAVMLCTDVSDMRLQDLADSFAAEAAAKGIEFIPLNPSDKDAYRAVLSRFSPPLSQEGGVPAPERAGGFDDIVVLAPVAALIADAATWLAPGGVLNIFAGVARGTMATFDVSDVYLRNVRYIGQSGSSIDDMRLMLYQAETGALSPNRSVAAIGSLIAAWDGIKAVKEQTFPGKIVIYPNIKELPLTPLADLKEKLPSVYARLKDGREWTNEAEAELFRLMIED